MELRVFEPSPVRRIVTRRRNHLPFDTGDPRPGGRYDVSTWDHEVNDWEPLRTGLRLMELRAVIRSLDGYWDPCSYLIERA